MRVYRLERRSDGTGPFMSIDDLYDHEDFDAWRYRHIGAAHPGPGLDGIILKETAVFGCPSREMIDFWFEPGYNMFKSADYVINVYNVHGNAVTVGLSGKQLVFNRDKATLVETIEIPS